MWRLYGSGMVAFSYGALASSFLSRGVIDTSDATSSVDCMQPPANKPKHRKARPRAAIILSSLALPLPRPGNGVVITQESYSFQNLPAPSRILAVTCGRNAAVQRRGFGRPSAPRVWRQLVNDLFTKFA